MSETIKAIETEYNGYRFRSRLEARWAVFFDAMGIKYEYEPEGYKLSNGEQYLPDFYLIDLDVYVEVKHCNADFISFDDDHVFFDGDETKKYCAFAHDATEAGHSVWFVFGDPYDVLRSEEHGGKGCNKFFTKCTCIFKKSEKPDEKCICNGGRKKVSDCKAKPILCAMYVISLGEDFLLCNMDPFLFPEKDYIYPTYLLDHMKTLQDYVEEDCVRLMVAMQYSRQARFEHGETPTNVTKLVVPPCDEKEVEQ